MAEDPQYNAKKCKEYSANHAEDVKAYRKSKKDHRLKTSAIWRAKNPEKWRIANNIRSERFRKANPERSKELKTANLAKRRQAEGTLSRGIIAKLKLSQGGQCVLCQSKLERFHLDHIQPLSRGGTHTDDNVQLLCPRCNLRKSNKLPHEFLLLAGPA